MYSHVYVIMKLIAESQPPGKPSYIQLKAFSREMIVSWGNPAGSDDIMVRGFKLGYGVVTPDEHWVLDQLGPGVRIKTLDGLGKMFVDSALS